MKLKKIWAVVLAVMMTASMSACANNKEAESTTGINETFTFNTDGTGYYSCITEDGTYECGFTYEFFRSNYVDIYYDDGDIGGFLIAIDGDTLTVRNDFVWDLEYTRQ